MRLLDRWAPSESVVLGGLAALVGLSAGTGVWAFKEAVHAVEHVALGEGAAALARWGAWTIALVPLAGGIVVGWIVQAFVGPERHHGVAGIMEAVALAGGRLRWWRIPAKAVAASISIGSGASVGPEDPSVQIGAGLGSMVGQRLRLSDGRVRTLVASGAAAAIAAAFGAPIAGVFFALEIILGELRSGALGVLLLAAVVSSAFTQAVSGGMPAFHVPQYALHSVWELPLYVGLGLLAGVVAALYVRALYRAGDLFRAWRAPGWTKPAVAGLVVGLVGIGLPQVFGVGYDTIDRLLHGEPMALDLLVLLLAAKLTMTAVCIGGGFPGGVFAPSLFMGAVLGAAVGAGAEAMLPTMPIEPAAFALVGMAAVLAGAVHAPLTAVMLLFEITHDYRIILPVMIAVAASLWLSQRFQRDSVYTLALTRKGIRLERGRDVEVLESITVGEVMEAAPVALRDDQSLEEAAQRMQAENRQGFAVVDGNGDLCGILTLQDVERARAEGRYAGHSVADAATRDLLVARPDETIGSALRRMGARGIGRLPVVSVDDPRRLVGVLRRSDVIRAYDLALTRRATSGHRGVQVRLEALRGVDVLELRVEPGSRVAERRIRDVSWPRDCVIASVRHGHELRIPHGDTLLAVGDVLAVVAEGEEAQRDLRDLCASRGADAT
jgi:CIC family chloride channel protein